MDYDFKSIESKWQAWWAANKTFKTVLDNSKPKYSVLDMFPYPSGAGLHVGHPLGYSLSRHAFSKSFFKVSQFSAEAFDSASGVSFANRKIFCTCL